MPGATVAQMQVLFGVAGRQPQATAAFERLKTETLRSNPGLDLSIHRTDGLQIGYALRRFASALTRDGLSLCLDGEIREVDGSGVDPSMSPVATLERLGELHRGDPTGFWGRLDGSYCLVLADDDVTAIGMDVAGTRGVYWWSQDGVLAFGSHLVDLAAAYPDPLAEDDGSLGWFLASGSYPPGRTAFRQIGHVGAGQYLRFTGDRVELRDHFAFRFSGEPAGPRAMKAAVAELADLLSASTATAARWMERPVFPLSGGLDSRYLVAEFAQQAGERGSIDTVTWGEDASRAGSDAVTAREVATRLGVRNRWVEKTQPADAALFARAIYLSSGEADCAIHFPEDHEIHAELARSGFASLVRGDECFGTGPTMWLRGAAMVVNGFPRLSLDQRYAALLPSHLLRRIAEEQADDLSAVRSQLRSATATGLRDEAYYALRMRRVLAPYNTVKHADLEVFTPYLARRVLEWLTRTIDRWRFDKALLRAALASRYPSVAAVPFATTNNLPDWGARWQDPGLPSFYREWCAQAGWLADIGAQDAVVAALDRHIDGLHGVSRGVPPVVRSRLRAQVMGSAAGRLLREATLERRFARVYLPDYLRLARLAVLHGLIGEIRRRAS